MFTPLWFHLEEESPLQDGPRFGPGQATFLHWTSCNTLMIPAEDFSFVAKSSRSFFPGLLWSDSPCLLASWSPTVGCWGHEVSQTPSSKKTAVRKSRKYDIRTHVPLKSRSPYCCSFGLSIRNVCYAKEWLPSQMPTRDRHLFFFPSIA